MKHARTAHSRRTAFTLVELSIVLVIIGLLTGGVLTGQALIHSAELRSIITERDKYITAVHAFEDKFLSLPGDMPNAYNFWAGKATGCTANTIPDTNNTNGGCNGDGNGNLGIGSNMNESVKAWMHLSLAGMIEGAYTGSGINFVGGTTAPLSRKAPNIWYFSSDSSMSNMAHEPITDPYPNGGLYLAYAQPGLNSNLSHGDAYNLDLKTDDGHANTGKTRGADGGDCMDENTNGNAADGNEDLYTISHYGENATGDCALTFILREQ